MLFNFNLEGSGGGRVCPTFLNHSSWIRSWIQTYGTDTRVHAGAFLYGQDVTIRVVCHCRSELRRPGPEEHPPEPRVGPDRWHADAENSIVESATFRGTNQM